MKRQAYFPDPSQPFLLTRIANAQILQQRNCHRQFQHYELGASAFIGAA
jgi:hypothetical protein